MSAFSEAKLAYLVGGRQLGRLATVGADGMPHVIPVGWSYNAELDSIDVGGRDPARTKRFRDVARNGGEPLWTKHGSAIRSARASST